MLFAQIRRFLLSEDGPTAVEYAMLTGLMSVAIVASIALFANTMSTTFGSVSSMFMPAGS